ncbi:MAG: hypothetical protein AB9M60_18450 [Leptothrix sp. (in: b-proteobacteria)]
MPHLAPQQLQAGACGHSSGSSSRNSARWRHQAPPKRSPAQIGMPHLAPQQLSVKRKKFPLFR